MQIRFIGSLFEVCAAIPLEEAGWPKARLRESIRGTLSCNPGKIILLNWSISMIANGTREPFETTEKVKRMARIYIKTREDMI